MNRPSLEHRRDEDGDAVVDLAPVVRRVVAARIRDPHVADDLVQETLTRVLAARSRVAGDDLGPYAIATARNLIATLAQRNERARRKAHLLADPEPSEPAGEGILRREESSQVGAALATLSPAERELLLAHEIDGIDTATLAAGRGSTAGAVAAQLTRTRAKLRVEFLLQQENVEPPTDRCRPVLRALSGADRRRQRELDASGHLLTCEVCSRLGAALIERRPSAAGHDEARVPVGADADIVTARQRGREVAAGAGFSGPELTLIATAISEIARNIVRFARRGEMLITSVESSGRTGVKIVARDVGPGIADVSAAMADGYSTYNGLGLGLPGARRLMDEFEVVSEVGRGTTVTMTKWRRSAGLGVKHERRETA